jgi:putative nucleotidyltransferase with HDIG domain
LAVLKSPRSPALDVSPMRASGQRRPWWAMREPRTGKPAEPVLTDAEHLICLRVGRRANEGDFHVPSMPAIAAEAVALLSTAEPEAEQVARLVQRDQQLAADVIFFANSSLFAGVMKVTNIPQAIARVGFHQARTLILASGLRRLVFSGCELDRAERLWRHSLGCAAIAACIAKNLRCNPNDAYLAGLFHDVGKAVALSLLDPGVLKSKSAPLSPDFVEHVIELYHEGLGVAVATQWRLPDHVIDVIRRHTEKDAATLTKPQAIVALADNACRRLNIGVKDDGRPIAGRVILDALGAELEDMGQVLDGVRSAVEPD